MRLQIVRKTEGFTRALPIEQILALGYCKESQGKGVLQEEIANSVIREILWLVDGWASGKVPDAVQLPDTDFGFAVEEVRNTEEDNVKTIMKMFEEARDRSQYSEHRKFYKFVVESEPIMREIWLGGMALPEPQVMFTDVRLIRAALAELGFARLRIGSGVLTC